MFTCGICIFFSFYYLLGYSVFFLPHILWKKGMRGIKKGEREGYPVSQMLCTWFSAGKESPGVLLLFSGYLHWFSVVAPPSICSAQYFLSICLNISSCIFLEIQEPSSSAAVILYLALASSNKKNPLNSLHPWEATACHYQRKTFMCSL